LDAFSQVGSERIVQQTFNETSVKIDSLSIYPSSFVVLKGKDTVDHSFYEVDYVHSQFKLLQPIPDSLTIHFQVALRLFKGVSTSGQQPHF
jgi:hypothetical protein